MVVVPAPVCGETPTVAGIPIPSDTVASVSGAVRTITQDAFYPGEKIRLSVRFMGIPCAEVVLSVSEQTVYRGRPVYVVHASARTNRAFSIIYEVNDTLTSYVDASGLFSWKYIKEIHETKDDTMVVYDYDHDRGVWSVDGVDRGPILPFTQDLLSSVYYLRGADWGAEGDTVSAPLNDTRKNYYMRFEMGRTRRLFTVLDWVTARVGRPVLELAGRYKQIGNNEVWFTDDRRRIPVLVKSHVLLGTFYAKLVEYEPGPNAPANQTSSGKR